MQSEWEFKFKAFDFIFEKEHKFEGTISEKNSFKPLEGYPETIPIFFRIVPSFEKDDMSGVKCDGSLFIKLPFSQEKAEKVVFYILHQIVERIKFNFGKFEIISGFITGEHIPENEEEKQQIGDKKYFVTMRFQEIIPEPIFDPKSFIKASSCDIDMLTIYNTAKEAIPPIDKFFGFFKILENRYTSNGKRNSLKNNLENRELFELYKKFINDSSDWNFFKVEMDVLVDIRHKCAHLKNDKKFGYLPTDTRVDTEVNKYLPIVEILSRELINL